MSDAQGAEQRRLANPMCAGKIVLPWSQLEGAVHIKWSKAFAFFRRSSLIYKRGSHSS